MKKFATLVLAFALVVSSTFASLSSIGSIGTAEEINKSNKYSVKSLRSYSRQPFSLSSYKNNLQLKNNLMLNTSTFSNVNGLQFDNGRTSYTIPFKYTVKVSKFKTPTSNN